MIAKISHTASLYGAVAYNQQKLDEGVARIISANRILSGIEEQNSMRQILRSFEPYLIANRRTKNP